MSEQIDKLEEVTNNTEPQTREALLEHVGLLLQTARQKKQQSLSQISNHLRLSNKVLQQLEDGQWSDMPGEVYALGFLRQYAQHLDIDVEQFIEQLKSDHYTLTKPLTFPDLPVSPARRWIIVSGLLFIILLVFFNMYEHEVAPLPSQLLQQHSKIISPINDVVSKSADPTLTMVPSIKPTTNLDVQSTSQTTVLVTPKPSPSKTVSNTKQADAVVSSHSYRLKATKGKVWLQLHKPGTPPILIREALLQQGQSMRLSHQQNLLLSTGNAPSLEIYMDKHRIIKAGQLGSQKNKVLHSYLLKTSSKSIFLPQKHRATKEN